MGSTKKIRMGAAASLFALGTLTACSSGTGTTAAPDPEGPIQVNWGLYQTSVVAPALAAMSPEEGIAEKYGLEFETTWITDNATGLALLQAGDIQAALTSYAPVIDANLQGLPFSIIAEVVVAVPDIFTFEALADSGIDSLSDLAGKTVGMANLTGSAYNKLVYAMTEEGIDPADVNFVELPYDQVGAALERGTIDVGWVTGSSQAELRNALDTKVIFDGASGDFEQFAESGINALTSWAEENPDTVSRIQCALTDGARLVEDDQDAYTRVVLEYTEITEADLAASPMPGFTDELRVDKLQQSADMMLALELIDEEFDVSDIVIPLPSDCAALEVE